MNTKLAEQMADLCEQSRCTEKIAKIHYDQALRDWHAHPPKSFEAWWASKPRDFDSKRAYNCQYCRDEYLEAKELGVV